MNAGLEGRESTELNVYHMQIVASGGLEMKIMEEVSGLVIIASFCASRHYTSVSS